MKEGGVGEAKQGKEGTVKTTRNWRMIFEFREACPATLKRSIGETQPFFARRKPNIGSAWPSSSLCARDSILIVLCVFRRPHSPCLCLRFVDVEQSASTRDVTTQKKTAVSRNDLLHLGTRRLDDRECKPQRGMAVCATLSQQGTAIICTRRPESL